MALTIHQRLPKDHRMCIGRTRGDKKTLVKSSKDRKLALHIGCTPNAKKYPRWCLPIISLLCTALAHAHAITYEKATLLSTRIELASTHIRIWVGFNPGSTRIHQKRVQCGHMQPELNQSSTQVQVAVQMCLKSSPLLTILAYVTDMS